MTQYVINIGALPNDGTGDPLRTAFNEVNLNFNQVWATGLVNSNIQIANNTIFTTNTNGNLVLNPNGIGNVVANAHVIPDQNRIRNLGSSTRKWDTVYAQYINVGGTLTVAGDVSVAGNLSVTGNIVELGNIITDAKTIQLANTAGTANSADGSGITVGANDNIATFLFSSSANAWTTDIGLQVGNIGFVGDAIYDLNGILLENADLTHGATAAVILPANGNANPIQVNNTYGNIVLQAGANSDITASWTFSNDGNITLPGNTSSINYANGTSILDGITTNKIFNGNSFANIATANGDVVVSSAGQNWTFDSNGGLTFPDGTFAQGDIEGTGNFGFETPANIGFGILANAGGQEWAFGSNGTLTLAGDITAKPVGFPFTSSITNITTGNPTVIVDIADNAFGAPVTGKVTIQGVLGTIEANEVWYYQAVEANQFQLFSDAACTVAVDGTAWTAYAGSGMAYAPAYDSMAISTGGLQVVAGPSSWYFGLDGNINTPSNLVIGPAGGSGSSILQNNAPLQVVGEGANSFVVAGWAENTAAPGNIAVIGFNAPYGNGAANVTINVGDNNATPYNWMFGNDGNLSLPPSGNIVGVTANNSGSLQWIGNSSGDGFGYTTLQLRPDDTRTDSDQYLIIDPTAPGHIHIRAGGTQDASGADLFLGGENSYVKVGSGSNPPVSITANSNPWTFGTDGILTLPATNVSAPAGEAAQFVGTRKIIGGITQTNPYSVALAAGGNATVAYTASSSTVNSVKITFAVQSSGSGFQWEQFDVVATPSQGSPGDVNFVVSNRVKAAASIGDTTVTATMNGSNQIEISLTLDPAQNSGGTASFDAVEFGLMID